MSRPPPTASRTSTLDSATSAPSPSQIYGTSQKESSNTHLPDMSNSQSNLAREKEPANQAHDRITAPGPHSAGPSPAGQQHTPSSATVASPPSSTALSGLVCNVHRTTGREPHPLVGATTTILGDRLFVFGGRILSRSRPQLTADLYELDLIRRHWIKVETRGDVPAPRYFHSVCALGDTKLVCYGGMSPAVLPSGQPTGGSAAQPLASNSQDPQPEVVVMSDIHIYDVPTRNWTYISTQDTPQGRYAHCATILPSSAMFTSAGAPLSAIHHNPTSSSGNPNQGSIGVSLDGAGGAEMVVVGGQDSANHYIEQISVFNLRSLRWIATDSLGKSCGAYRSVVAPLNGMTSSQIGKGSSSAAGPSDGRKRGGSENREHGSSMLIYSNYNFLDVKLELQVRLPDGTLTEKPMRGDFSPPGLRFPNGGVLDRHLVISGTYLTSSKQEYALWALDLSALTWSRIDAGGNHFSQGSWNRGVLWSRRNTFVVLGNRKRSLVEDYNHRRINFSNVCMVELEAFGMYDNPRKTSPMSGFVSASAPEPLPQTANGSGGKPGGISSGRPHTSAAEELGRMAMGLRELADMDFLAMGGERVPVSSRIVAQRWGPYFVQLLKEGAASNEQPDGNSLRPHMMPGGPQSRNSSVTITPSIGASSVSTMATLTVNNREKSGLDWLGPPTSSNLPPIVRPRTLYLPHTHHTLQTLVHFLYTSSLPAPHHPLCTPQILCSLLQVARPYRIDGLLEAVVERLHQVLDGRNAAAVFNAAAMAAGGGQGLGAGRPAHLPTTPRGASAKGRPDADADDDGLAGATREKLRINTSFGGRSGSRAPGASSAVSDGESSDVSSATSTVASSAANGSEYDDGGGGGGLNGEREIWAGEVSSVVGLQKRGLRGLMEGRRIRERGKSASGAGAGGGERVGLGIKP
ncbi:MAG: hypothetical protein M1832_004690 [Thelocarpon impressellum]|nr:MAG: hypothetical protein M1832_004690 [Thelocarpon impressellum]